MSPDTIHRTTKKLEYNAANKITCKPEKLIQIYGSIASFAN